MPLPATSAPLLLMLLSHPLEVRVVTAVMMVMMLIRVFLGRRASHPLVHVISRLGHLVHLSRRAKFTGIHRLIWMPLQRRLLERLLDELAPPIFRQLA